MKNTNMGRIIFIFVSLIFIGGIQAQPGKFSIKVTQVYPSGGVVYGNTYNLSSELEQAEKKLFTQYSSRKNANFVIELSKPSGKISKNIQNIQWVKKENQKLSYFGNKPNLALSYNTPTTVEIYACDLNGKKKPHKDNCTVNYTYYYQLYFGSKKQSQELLYYRNQKTSEDNARKLLKNSPYNNDRPWEIKIYNKAEKDKLIASFDNKKEREEFAARSTRELNEGNVKKNVPKTTQDRLTGQRENDSKSEDFTTLKTSNRPLSFDEKIACIIVKSNYDSSSIDNNLKSLRSAINGMRDGSHNFLTNITLAISKADEIIAVMKNNPKKKEILFDRNKYFEKARVNDLRKGIEELIKINNGIK